MGTVSRRKFIGTAAAGFAGVTLVPSNVIAGLGHKAPSDKLNIAGIGVGGMGYTNLLHMETENIVALCDVDSEYAGRNSFRRWYRARQYKDYRVMLEEQKDIDAVMIATPDHSHALPALIAMRQGIHVYLQKPLTHSVYESRIMTETAQRYSVATQMGNQGNSADGIRQICEWIWAGTIGEVTHVDTWTNRPIWPQGLTRPEKGKRVPKELDWDLFIGPAQFREYNPVYHPWNWRGWWDYGTGALGDMACHILHPVFVGLNLGYPIHAQGNSSLLLNDCAPVSQSVKLTFPERKTAKKAKMKLPQVDVYWYDGGIKPMLPEAWPDGKNPNNSGGGVLFHGTKDTLVCGCYGKDPWLLSGRTPDAPKFRRRVETSHEMDWVRACKESPENRVKTASDFSEAGPFNEMVVMGVLAVRLQSLNKVLDWDGEKMEFTNLTDDEKIKTVVKDGFKIHDGHPTFDKSWTDPVSAKEFAAELIKHTYRKPWSLPDMPA